MTKNQTVNGRPSLPSINKHQRQQQQQRNHQAMTVSPAIRRQQQQQKRPVVASKTKTTTTTMAASLRPRQPSRVASSNELSTSPSPSPSPSRSPPMFGLRFWVTCCFVTVIHQAFYGLANVYSSSSEGSSSSSSSSPPSFNLQQQLQADWRSTVAATAAASHHFGVQVVDNRSLRGVTNEDQNHEQQQQQQQAPPQQTGSPPAASPATPSETHTDTDNVDISTSTTTTTITTDQKRRGLTSEQEAEYWSKNGCIYVENLCHSTYSFFYDTPDDQDESNHFEDGHGHDSTPWQPNLELDFNSVFARGYPQHVVVGRGKPADMRKQPKRQPPCYHSPVSHHLMYSTPFNHMMVEFYIRTMTGLKPILLGHPHLPENHVQTYLILYNYAKVLDGHRLFTNTLPTSNPVLPFQALFDTTKCQCMPKAIFCGFKNTPKTETLPVGDGAAESKAIAAVTSDIASSTTSALAAIPVTPVQNVTTSVLRPFADILGGGIYREKRRYPGLRKHVREELFDGNNALLQSLVKEYRLTEIQRVRGTDVEMNDVDDYILIGLTQRSGRRKWSNMKRVMKNCNTYQPFVDAKIVCLEVNMDFPSSHVLQQAVIHGSLQAFVGIHGSHFVNAVMLPHGATILEVLPWFPDWMRFGREWARRTDKATPVGAMFFNSDLNHVGLALERSSAPQICSNYTMGSVEDEECLFTLAETDKDAVWWGTRDFVISWSVVHLFINQFMMPDSKPDLCDDFVKIQEEKKITMEGSDRAQSFALYNVNCRDKEASKRAHTWHSYNNYTLDEEARLKILMEQGTDKPPSRRKVPISSKS